MLAIEYTTQFKRDLKKAKKRGYNLTALRKIMQLIEYEKPLPDKLKNHTLTGSWSHHNELHIAPDWLLIYRLASTIKTVVFVRTGTHSDLF